MTDTRFPDKNRAEALSDWVPAVPFLFLGSIKCVSAYSLRFFAPLIVPASFIVNASSAWAILSLTIA